MGGSDSFSGGGREMGLCMSKEGKDEGFIYTNQLRLWRILTFWQIASRCDRPARVVRRSILTTTNNQWVYASQVRGWCFFSSHQKNPPSKRRLRLTGS